MKRFYENVPASPDEVMALTAAITSEVMLELDLDKDLSSRLYGTVETAILNELSKEKN
jgi:hypothetical protein